MTTQITVTGDNLVYLGLDGWLIQNNVWNNGDLINGTDYTEVLTADADLFPRGVTFTWDWPDLHNEYYVFAYPTISIGQRPWNPLPTTFDNLPILVPDIESLDLNFDMDWTEPAGSDFNISVSLWLSSGPEGGMPLVENEIMVWLRESSHVPAGFNTGVSGTDGLGTYEVWYQPDQTDASAQTDHIWDFIVPTYDTVDIRAGTMDVDALLQTLMTAGLIEESMWLNGIELGPEIVQREGSFTINDISLDLVEVSGLGTRLLGTGADNVLNARHGNDTVEGLGGDDELWGMSGNDSILGGQGADTLRGGSGDDTLDAGTDNARDLIDAGRGNDVIRVSGTDGVWDNVFFTDIGTKVITGTGTGNDLIGHHMSFTDQRAGVDINMATGMAKSALLSVDFTTAMVFNVIAGSGYNDTFTAGNAAFSNWEQFTGFGGNDRFIGDDGVGFDAVAFGDEITVGWWDVANSQQYFGDRGAVVNLATGTGTDTFDNTNTFLGIEALTGTTLGDSFTGGAEDNFFIGGQGVDTLVGGAGQDTLNYTAEIEGFTALWVYRSILVQARPAIPLATLIRCQVLKTSSARRWLMI